VPEPKTKRTEKSAADFFATIKDEQVRKDCKAISAVMQAATKESPSCGARALSDLAITAAFMPAARNPTGCSSLFRRASKTSFFI